MNYEQKLQERQVERLPHGKLIAQSYIHSYEKWAEYGSQEEIPTCLLYTGHIKLEGNWAHIYEDNGEFCSIPSTRVVKIEWDKRWKVKKARKAREKARQVIEKAEVR